MNKNSTPLVSILIACYNGEKYIHNCINSCINQTYENIEIIIINDGSNDNSKEILKWWTHQDSRIKLINYHNQGLAQTRNLLINEANGEYFTFLDIDDTIKENAIELLINETQNNNCDIVVGRTNLIYERKILKKVPFIPTWWITSNMSNDNYVKSNICTPWASLINKEYFKSLNIQFIPGRVFEDIGVMPFIYLKTNKFKTIKDVIYFYKRYKKSKKVNNLSSFESVCFKKINDIGAQLNQLFKYLSQNNLLKTKSHKRIINGILFQVLPATIFLSQNLTNNKYYQYLVNYNIMKMINSYGINFKFSKTFWKSLAFFYIFIKNFQVINNITKNKRWKFYINGTTKKTQGYVFLDSSKNKITPSRYKIYEVSFTNILNYNIDGDSRNTNIALSLDQWNPELVKKSLFIMQKCNSVPFVNIKINNLTNKDIQYLQEETLGILIDLRFVSIKICEKIINTLLNSNKQKMVFLIANKSDESKINHIKPNINGVFWHEQKF